MLALKYTTERERPQEYVQKCMATEQTTIQYQTTDKGVSSFPPSEDHKSFHDLIKYMAENRVSKSSLPDMITGQFPTPHCPS
jgi:hypothetical protein